jgi:hypothetical protein
MNLDAVVHELHQIVAEKTPKGTSPQLILERLRASFPPLHPREVSNEEAKAILLKRGGPLAQNKPAGRLAPRQRKMALSYLAI